MTCFRAFHPNPPVAEIHQRRWLSTAGSSWRAACRSAARRLPVSRELQWRWTDFVPGSWSSPQVLVLFGTCAAVMVAPQLIVGVAGRPVTAHLAPPTCPCPRWRSGMDSRPAALPTDSRRSRPWISTRFRGEFNRDAGVTRPPVCGGLRSPGLPVKVFAVWEPMLSTDWMRPTTGWRAHSPTRRAIRNPSPSVAVATAFSGTWQQSICRASRGTARCRPRSFAMDP